MLITDSDIEQIDFHGYDYSLAGGELKIEFPHAIGYVHKRPSYCDRGRFGFLIEVRDGHVDKLTVDHADCFPRYFFKLQRALDEMRDWIEFNKQKWGL